MSEEISTTISQDIATSTFQGTNKEVCIDDYEDHTFYDTVFQITYEVFGEVKVIDLIPNGGNIRVNEYNRQQYVELYVKYVMEDSIKTQFAAFARGFMKVDCFSLPPIFT